MEAKIEFEKSVMSVCTNKECILLWVPQIWQEKLEEYFNSLDKKDEKKLEKAIWKSKKEKELYIKKEYKYYRSKENKTEYDKNMEKILKKVLDHK